MRWHLTIVEGDRVLSTTSTRSLEEVEQLSVEARRVRPEVESMVRPPPRSACRYE
jgi:hypothetical protein